MANNLAGALAVVGSAGRFPGAPASAAHSTIPQPLVEIARAALHEAGCDTGSFAGSIGLFVAAHPTANGGSGDDLASELARQLDLRGPAVTVEGSAPAALATLDRAGQSLQAAECDLALAIASATNGETQSGVVALKRLPVALVAGDRILALVHGSAAAGGGDLLFGPPPVPPGPAPGSAAATEIEPRPSHERPALANAYVPPADHLEAAIADIWQEQLGIDRVGVEDNFFELGGTSLAGVKIVALLKEWLHQDIPTVSLYEGPTVRALAKVIVQGDRGSQRSYDAVRERGERRRRKLQRLAQGAGQGTAE